MLASLANLDVVLVRPKLAENVGAAARAIGNMGLGCLKVVLPASLSQGPMRALATGHGGLVLDAMTTHPSLDDALADCHHAVATTARLGDNRGSLMSPRAAAPEILAWAAEERVALLFGPEDRGLTTPELDRARLSLNIPTSESSSLNLAQAVMVLAYELRNTALDLAHQTARGALHPKPAPLGEQLALLEHLTTALVAINKLPASNPGHFMRVLKQPLERAGMTKREVRAWRGVARQILWLAGKKEEGEGEGEGV
ncbi:MAG: RNA methyltransferase [Deltaproteobacteria bacterium]|nr:RNA methyltransferase [Deltaproteobacteria bacterium]